MVITYINAQEPVLDIPCCAEKELFANCVFRIQDPGQGQRCDDCRIKTIHNITAQDGDVDELSLTTSPTRTCN